MTILLYNCVLFSLQWVLTQVILLCYDNAVANELKMHYELAAGSVMFKPIASAAYAKTLIVLYVIFHQLCYLVLHRTLPLPHAW